MNNNTCEKILLLLFLYALATVIIVLYKWSYAKYKDGKISITYQVCTTLAALIFMPAFLSAVGNDHLSNFLKAKEFDLYQTLILLSYIAISVFAGSKVIDIVISSFNLKIDIEKLKENQKQHQKEQRENFKVAKEFDRNIWQNIIDKDNDDLKRYLNILKEIEKSEDGTLPNNLELFTTKDLLNLSYLGYINSTKSNNKDKSTIQHKLTPRGGDFIETYSENGNWLPNLKQLFRILHFLQMTSIFNGLIEVGIIVRWYALAFQK